MGRFAKLVDTPERMAAFRTKYRIPENVVFQHCELGEWLVMNKPPSAMVIPMISFIEGGMEIPMNRVTRDFLINFRLSLTQCSPNLFRVLGSVDMINRKMGTNLTWHDINWVYNFQKGKEMSYHFKCRVPSVRLISCIPESNKGMDEDFLIVLGEWHDGLHCPTQDGEPGGVLTARRIT